MNYYNPYFSYPYMMSQPAAQTVGFLINLFKGGINWSSILSGTQKTLNIANQAIPLVKQISPVMKNAKTMFNIMNEFKKVDTPTVTTAAVSKEKVNEENYETITNNSYQEQNNGPKFFI